MSARLTLISHASTAAVHAAAFPLDEPIDDQGREKAMALTLERGRVDAALTSPSLRARQTAAALQLDAVVDPVLRDIDLGSWSGRSWDEVRTSAPDALAAWITDANAAPHGGESVAALIERLRPWLESIRSDGRRVVAVTHPAVIRAVLIVAIEAEPRSFWRIDVAPLCRASFSGNALRWTLRSLG